MTRVIIDANVLASGIAGHPHSPSRRLFEALAADRIEAVLCDRISVSSTARSSARTLLNA